MACIFFTFSRLFSISGRTLLNLFALFVPKLITRVIIFHVFVSLRLTMMELLKGACSCSHKKEFRLPLKNEKQQPYKEKPFNYKNKCCKLSFNPTLLI